MAAEVRDDALRELARLALVERRAGNGAGEEGNDRRRVAAGPAQQPLAQLAAGGAAEHDGDAGAGRERVEPAAAYPGTEVRRSPDRRAPDDTTAVDLVQLGDELHLDRDDGKGLGRDLHGRGQ